MATFSHPKLASIDDAMTQLEPILETFAQPRGFALTRSHEGSLNVPRRWLQRRTAGVFQEIGLIVSSPMPDRLALGFYPEIPCSLYVSAQINGALLHDQIVAESVPFCYLSQALADHLLLAVESLESHMSEYLQA